MTPQLQYGYDGTLKYGQYYHHTGKVTFIGVLSAGVAGLVAGAVAAALYAYGDVYIPIIYANVLLCFAFGAGVGVACAYVMRWGKVRNVPVTLAIVGVVTLASYYVCWVVWIFAQAQRGSRTPVPVKELFDLLINPKWVYGLAIALNAQGTWAMSTTDKSNVSGVFLYIVWLGEAALIFGSAIWAARLFATDRPFCETCDAWCAKGEAIARVAPAPADQLRPRLEARDFQYLRDLAPHARSDSYVELTHHQCRSCGRLHTLTATLVTITAGSRGRNNTKRKVLVDKLLLTPEEFGAANAAARQYPAPPPMAPSAPVGAGGATPPPLLPRV